MEIRNKSLGFLGSFYKVDGSFVKEGLELWSMDGYVGSRGKGYDFG